MSLARTQLTITRKDAEAEVRTFLPGDYVIGRGSEADIRIETPLISRAHARLRVRERECLIEDLGSSHGTFVNGERVETVTILSKDECVMLGATVTLEIRRLPSPAIAAGPKSTLSPGTRREALRTLLPPEFLYEKKYDMRGVIAEGGMGAVVEARELTIQRDVAMKVMLHGDTPADVMRFIAEAKITGQLEHPNIIPVHELGVDDKEQVYYTMKYVHGATLRQVLDRLFDAEPETVKAYPLAQLLTIFQKVCDAVAFAHSKGVIHRDLKPENVMLGDFGEVLVTDWGLAKVLDPSLNSAASDEGHSIIRTGVREELHAAEIESGNVLGTPQYMAPEQAYGQHDNLDTRTDIYALGAILHHVLTLRPPVEGEDAQTMVSKAAAGDFQPARSATLGGRRLPHLPQGKVPQALSAVAEKAMAKFRDERYQMVQDLQADIRAYQGGFATTAENAGALKQTLLFLRRRRFLAGSLAMTGVLLVALGLHLFKMQHLASQALFRMHAAAPALADQARQFLAHGQTQEALEKINFAADLAPESAEYARLQGDAFTADLQLAAAARAYHRALSLDAASTTTRDSLALVERLLSRHPDSLGLSREELQELAALAQRQRRPEAAIFRSLAVTAQQNFVD